MVSLPFAWEQEQLTEIGSIVACPYSDDEICEYLTSNQYHWLTSEPEANFEVQEEIVAKKNVGARSYWIRLAKDSLKRDWYVLIGSGRSPFNPSKFMRRWMMAETNDDESTPPEFLARHISEQEDNDRLQQAH